LGIGRAPVSRFLLSGIAALILKLAAVEAHGSMLDCRTGLSSGTMPSAPSFSRRQAGDQA
jgi:hypothetical protein